MPTPVIVWGSLLAKSIEEDIANGTTVIVDRYSYSGVVYSAAKANPTLVKC
jgi:dTMP kinase